ncbi:MAG: hypothetical protein HFE86_03765 [Clostridiales bacterium]|nr:hypothetical protein [Clostridiales bacterium]
MENEKKNLRQRLRNFWYYYKVHTIIGLLIAALLAVLIAQCGSRVSPDYTVVLYMRKELSEPMTNAMAAELQKFGIDRNGDGKVVVEIVNCSFDTGARNEVVMGSIGKMQGQLSLPDAPLMITDKHTFADLNEQGVFAARGDLPDQEGKALQLKDTPLYEAVNSVKPNYLVNDLYLSIRDLETGGLQDNKFAGEFLSSSQALLENLLAAYVK